MENCRNILISLPDMGGAFLWKQGWNPVSQFQTEYFERCTVLLYH